MSADNCSSQNTPRSQQSPPGIESFAETGLEFKRPLPRILYSDPRSDCNLTTYFGISKITGLSHDHLWSDRTFRSDPPPRLWWFVKLGRGVIEPPKKKTLLPWWYFLQSVTKRVITIPKLAGERAYPT